MAWPLEMQTVEVTFGPGTSLVSGQALGMVVTFTPSRSVTWQATGTPLVAMSETAEAEEGMQGTLHIPNPDQAGFIDGNGNTVRNFTYRADVQYLRDRRIVQSAYKVFTLTAGDTVIDLDNLIPATSAAGVVVSIPDSWSQNVVDALAAAQAAAQSAQDADATAAAAVSAASGSAAAAASSAAAAQVSRVAADDKVASIGKGLPNGVASLDGNTLLPEAQVPTRLTAATMALKYVRLDQTAVAYDTDGIAYFTDAVPFASAVPILTDTDGVPYLGA